MSTELERRLRAAFERLPEPGADVSRRARAAVVAALPAPAHRSRSWALLVVAAAAAAIGVGAGSLAAAGKLHVDLGARARPPAQVPTRLAVPAGTHGIAVVAGGKLWLATRRGLRIEAMPVSAAELSPRALYAVVGLGSSLVALAPGQRTAWTHQTGGRVLAAAWSPDGLKIAYVIRGRRGSELRLIEGDGDNDRLLDSHVAPTKPSWRVDSLAVAYVRPSGRAAVFDLTSGSRRTFDTRRCSGPARAVAYAPTRPRLAVAGGRGVALVGRWAAVPGCAATAGVTSIDSLAWAGPRQVVVAGSPRPLSGARSSLRAYLTAGADLAGAGGAFSRRAIRAAVASPSGRSIAVVVQRTPRVLELALAVRPANSRENRLRLVRPLLRLRGSAGPVSISWR
jgi:hypothetical protein